MSSSLPPPALLAVLYQRLKTALADEAARRYGEDIAVSRIDSPSPSAEQVRFRIDGPNLPDLTATLAVTAEEDGPCDVLCAIDGGSTRRVSCTVPPANASPPAEDSQVGRALATFLLNEVQEELSRLVLDGGNAPFMDVV